MTRQALVVAQRRASELEVHAEQARLELASERAEAADLRRELADTGARLDAFQRAMRADIARDRAVGTSGVNGGHGGGRSPAALGHPDPFEGYTGPRTKKGAPDKRTREGRAWYEQATSGGGVDEQGQY